MEKNEHLQELLDFNSTCLTDGDEFDSVLIIGIKYNKELNQDQYFSKMAGSNFAIMHASRLWTHAQENLYGLNSIDEQLEEYDYDDDFDEGDD